ncbi:MAG: DNA polymerase III subunit alpha, partial [Myxococcota bacterium]
MSDFVHLHLHSQYSLLDGAIKLNYKAPVNLFKALEGHKMDTVAVTDHGNMFGVIEFQGNAKAAGVKPIIGCEVYVAGDAGRFDRSVNESNHLVLLAKDLEGYANLAYLVSMGYVEGFYYKPRIDMQILRDRARGLVGMTACLGGQIPRLLLAGRRDQAFAMAKNYREIFDPGSFFMELQRTGLEEQDRIAPDLMQFARDLDVGVVATNDCHYVRREDAHAHDILMCIQTQKEYNDPKRLRHDTNAYYIRSGEEMEALFSDIPEAIANTRRIADMCNVKLNLGKSLLPKFRAPDGFEVDDWFERLAREGFERRKAARGLHADAKTYADRLDFEIATIKKMGFSSYFLIVSDFINFARGKSIPVGPGRGSGAGSLVAYSLSITDLDPIRHGLIFERFLNPDRVSMPDIDTDFCERRRGEVIAYVKEKYGEKNVGQIVTFSQLKTKSIIKDVSRTLSVPFDEINKITRGIPGKTTEENPRDVTVDMALELVPELRDLADRDPRFADVIEVSRTLEGLNRQTGVHAAGVVIAERPLWELVPVCLDKSNQLITQFSMNDAEKAGLIKFDFLGLKTLTMIDNAVRMLRADGVDVDINELTLDDKTVFDLISTGETDGVFQLESSGFKEMLRRLKPTRFEEIVAATALYRPGPLKAGMVDEYIDRKNGRRKVTYPHAAAELCLKETYGVIVYQEQVMQLSVALSGFSMGKADLMRKAMGKKKIEEMEKLGADFKDGAVKVSGMPQEA